VWAQYTVNCNNRDELQARLKRAGIPTMVYYVKPMHLLDAMSYLGGREGDFPVAEATSDRVMSLPMHPYLVANDIDNISQALFLALDND
jgi:UDP-2-acetamido-2-deoxy-ribo-hexuluronate aminotransferase